jgi:hypothetical protein
MIRFTIRDMLWLTAVVAVALTLWLGWSRETAKLREESASQEAKLREEVAAERAKGMEKFKGLVKEHTRLMVKSNMQEALLEG